MTQVEKITVYAMAKVIKWQLEYFYKMNIDLSKEVDPELNRVVLETAARNAEDLVALLRKHAGQPDQSGKAGE